MLLLICCHRRGFGGRPERSRNWRWRRAAGLDDDGRLFFPKSLVEDVIAGAARDFVLHGQSPDHDIEVRDGHVHFATGGAAVKMLDFDEGTYRPSTLDDLYQIARVADTMANIQWFARPVVATDVEDIRELDLNTVYAIARGTQKHLGTSITFDRHVTEIIEMLDLMTGQTGGFQKRPFLSVHATTIVSPLTFAQESSDVASAAARAGDAHSQPDRPASRRNIACGAGRNAGTGGGGEPRGIGGDQSGGARSSCHCQRLAFVADLRTGAFSGGGGEQALLSSAQSQMMRYYKLPTGVPAGMTDAKLPDNQAGYEKALTVLMAAQAGPDFVYESVGMMASLLGFSLEAMTIDDEMITNIRRILRGIHVTDDTLSLDVIDDVARGPGHFLGNAQTLAMMESEYVYPELADRDSPDNWHEKGSMDIWRRACERVFDILNAPHPDHITDENDDVVRARFPIRLPLSSVGRDNSAGKG